MSRIPFVAAVVGALLIGGATTGGTHASWVQSAELKGSSVKAGIMSFTAPSPTGTSTLVAGSSTSTNIEVVLTDDSSPTARNLRQAVRVTGVAKDPVTGGTLNLAQLKIEVTQKGTSCATTVPTLSASGYTSGPFLTTVPIVPPAAAQHYTLCIRLAAASGASAASGTLSVELSGRQQSAVGADIGWTTRRTVQIPVSVSASSPILTCPNLNPGTKNEMPLSWTNPSGTTQTVVEFKTTQDGTFGTASNGSSAANSPATSYTMTHSGQNNDAYTYYYRVRFVGSATPSSNTVAITRNGSNGNGNMTCVVN